MQLVDKKVAALFVQTGGCYYGLPHVDPWDEARDARLYNGPYPVIAHPPCQLWGALSRVNYKRWGGEHNRPGNDNGCFASAIGFVRRFGGVLEHPAKTFAWEAFCLPRPRPGKWVYAECGGWVCEVWQSAYGHKANKATWLYFVGPSEPPMLNWDRPIGNYQIGCPDTRGKERNKPTLSKREANATPVLFRDLLISMAMSVYAVS